ncbi:ABC transporter permease [Acetivibrio straminisolvens]|jgi:NitT/TauT family transport system permease protein|uniref:ABC-type nitrate/sulfonate/bicarbonate transport system n=1 Tax=Acetivibrio straminisolvens JCM 21531 TaxID=1294263 RepID=W4V4W9_9FIRM|nr:ABC transporter permease subunit [Acetivibrio straminisolvens]GAE88212.1 ABC-type nitrate/sulfonate/bicarbonate transport system [Acetivibrio straminisolvens JCM 21531]
MKISILKNNVFKELIYTVVSIIAMLIIWKIVSVVVNKEVLIPSPEVTLREIIRIVESPAFFGSVLNTSKRAIIGFLIALGTGMLFGMLGGLFKAIYYLLRPFVLIIKAVPTMAMILLTLIWLESEKAPILVGFVVIFPIIYENVVQGIRNVDSKLVEMMKVYNINKLDTIKELYIPSIVSYLNGAMSAAAALNLKIVIAAEVLSQPKLSMGTSFQMEKANLNTAGVFAWSLIAIFMAGVFEQMLRITKIARNGKTLHHEQ